MHYLIHERSHQSIIASATTHHYNLLFLNFASRSGDSLCGGFLSGGFLVCIIHLAYFNAFTADTICAIDKCRHQRSCDHQHQGPID